MSRDIVKMAEDIAAFWDVVSKETKYERSDAGILDWIEAYVIAIRQRFDEDYEIEYKNDRGKFKTSTGASLRHAVIAAMNTEHNEST